jgi:hypothetical protein
MQVVCPQQFMPRNPAAVRPPAHAEFSTGTRNSAYALVAASAGLGLVFGLTLAVLAGNGQASAAPQDSASLPSHASGLQALPASYTGPVTSLLSQVDPQKGDSAASPLSSPAIDKSALGSLKGKKHGLRKSWNSMEGSGGNQPDDSPDSPAASEAPTASQLTSYPSPAAPFFQELQGDATVAGFDAGTGTIETHEGQTFVLDQPAGENSAIHWPDFPFNVHYRCDQSGGCTLAHGGATASAKLTR